MIFPPSFLHCSKSQEKGIALLLVLWVLVLLTVIVGQFCYSIRTELTIIKNFRDETKGYYLARAGMNRALLEILNPQPTTAALPVDDPKALPKRAWRANSLIPPVALADGSYQVTIENESGKFNINVADSPLLTMMLEPFNLPKLQKYTIVESILDWRDMDHLHRYYGAENEYYQSLPNPYMCNNGPFRSIEELLLVRGMTKELFDSGLKDMITVYKDPDRKQQRTLNQNINPQKKRYKININAAPASVLRCLPGLTDEKIMAINQFRKDKDIRYLHQLKGIVGLKVYEKVSEYLTVDESTFYTIRATGSVDDSRTKRTIETVVKIDRRMQEYDTMKWLDYQDQTL